MSKLTQLVIRVRAQRRNLAVTAFAALVVLVVCVWLMVPHDVVIAPEEIDVVTIATSSSSSEVLVLPSADPVRIVIPKIDVNAEFEHPVGLEYNGEIGTPHGFETVAYYKYGPTPGMLGPSVVLGHVDSYQGPAVFYSLGQLSVGDEIFIDRADGVRTIFTVQELERYPQSNFPTEKVYSDLPYAGLRLITCSGIYDHGSMRYSHNLVVFAELSATTTVPTAE